jgi:hypothetical protein
MTPSAGSVSEGALVGTSESGYRWTCSMCGGLGLVEEESKLANCPVRDGAPVWRRVRARQAQHYSGGSRD